MQLTHPADPQRTRWEVLDQLVKSFGAAVDDPDRPLSVPLRR